MLVLSRKSGERIHIGKDIVLTVVAVKGNRVRLAFEAPESVRIHREEVLPGGSHPVEPARTADQPPAAQAQPVVLAGCH